MEASARVYSGSGTHVTVRNVTLTSIPRRTEAIHCAIALKPPPSSHPKPNIFLQWTLSFKQRMRVDVSLSGHSIANSHSLYLLFEQTLG
jgi:hypothetical protein